MFRDWSVRIWCVWVQKTPPSKAEHKIVTQKVTYGILFYKLSQGRGVQFCSLNFLQGVCCNPFFPLSSIPMSPSPLQWLVPPSFSTQELGSSQQVTVELYPGWGWSMLWTRKSLEKQGHFKVGPQTMPWFQVETVSHLSRDLVASSSGLCPRNTRNLVIFSEHFLSY